MPSCKVYGTKPGKGPSQLAAQAALNSINGLNPTWGVTLNYNQGLTEATYVSNAAGVGTAALETAVQNEFVATGYDIIAW
jgi:hypothetical protein